MSEIDAYNARMDAFQRDTGIWPPGRDMPAAFCGGDDDRETTRLKAWAYWAKTRTAVNSHDALVEALRNAAAVLEILEQSSGVKQDALVELRAALALAKGTA